MVDSEEFLSNLTLRISDHDDSDYIQTFMANPVYSQAANRVFGVQMNVRKLIQTSFLSVTVLSPQKQIIAFAVFDDHPPGLRSNDGQHENFWQIWLQQARGLTLEFNSINSLWLQFFFVNVQQNYLKTLIFGQILQSAYQSLPIVQQTLLMVRGEASIRDMDQIGFNFIRDKFVELELDNREVLSEVRGVHFNSKFFLSSRNMVIRHMEIRIAREEDHDNLAAVFNSQSDVITQTYGDYFIAELIAAQSETSKSLVAQVDDKAVGMLTLRLDIDTQLLWQCFELDIYDNLLDPAYMDIVREKRAEIIERRRIEAKERALQEAKRLREETMVCNIIAQRIALQEHLKLKEDTIFSQFEEIMRSPDMYQQIDQRAVSELIEQWLDNFSIQQPSEYFLDHPSDDPNLVCNILNESEFFLECLQFFGLPEGYMQGHGHFEYWFRRKQEEQKQSQAQKGALFSSKMLGKGHAKRGDRRAAQQVKLLPDKPEHFDLEPLRDAMQMFLQSNSDARTKFRQEVKRTPLKLEYVFRKDDGQVDPNLYSVNTTNFFLHLEKAGFVLDTYAKVLGPMLRCFGLLITKNQTKTVEPPQQVQQEKKAAPKNVRGRGRVQQEKEQKVQMSIQIQQGVKVDFQKNKQGQLLPAQVTLMKTSLSEVLKALEYIEDFDKTLFQLGLLSGEELQDEIEGKKKPDQDEELDDFGSKASSVKAEQEKAPIEPEQPDHFTEYDQQELQYRHAVEDLDDLQQIPLPPQRAKNAFCLVLYCLDAAFESFGIEFLQEAFEQFPDRDYMVITQPHTVPENSLMKFFTHIPKKPNNTFSHVLYIMHRDCLLYHQISVKRTTQQDFQGLDFLISTSENPQQIVQTIKNSISDLESPYLSFTVRCKQDIIGLYILTKDVNLRYYQSHFDIESNILVNQHRRDGHTRVVTALINPIFLKCQNLILKDVLRLTNKTTIHFQIHDLTVIPDVFHQLIYIRSRKFPHFLNKPWEHQKALGQEFDGEPNQDGFNRKFQDEKQSDFALSLITKKYLSQQRVVVNHRIVVVGASDTGISFIQTLLSNMYIQFNNIYLLAPGGLAYYHIKEEHENLKSSSTNYSLREQIRLLLENRVSVIDGRMIEIQREDKRITLHDGSMLNYDILVLTMGLQDCTLQKIGRISRGIAPIPDNKIYLDGVISIDDPYLYQHFRPEGNIMAVLNHRKMPGTTLIYGYTLHAYCFIQGLIIKGINPTRIKLVIPDPQFEFDQGVNPLFGGDQNVLANHSAFEQDQNVQERVFAQLEKLEISVYKHASLLSVQTDQKGNLTSVLISQGEAQITVNCRVLVTAGISDVDDEIFSSIHKNGLVFNGRFIVNNQFLTTDASIYAGGSLCEFSQQFRHLAPGQSLRMDRYNGREVGIALARSVLSMIDLQALEGLFQEAKQDIPYLFMPRGKGGILPGGYFYYHLVAPQYAEPKVVRQAPKNRPDVVSNTLNELDGQIKGHYIKFTFSNIGLVDSVTYLSKDAIQIQSLWKFVGLSETYLNKLSERFDNNLLPDVAEFLSENWAMALYHDSFAGFSNQLKSDLKEALREILETSESVIDAGQGISREQIEKMKALVPRDMKRMVQESTLMYIRNNLNHMPMYYIPGVEFP